jgi:hypothetical protein
MTHTLTRKLSLIGSAAAVLSLLCSLPLRAQQAAETATQITDAQAQALINILATQNDAGATRLTAAQNQMLLQYMLTTNKASAAGKSAAVPAVASIGAVQTRKMVAGSAAAVSGFPDSSALLTSRPVVPVSNAASEKIESVNDKKPGVVRIGITMPKTQMGSGAQGPTAGEPLRAMLMQYLAAPSVEVIPIAALLQEQGEAEGKAKQCDFLVYSSMSQKKPGGGGFLKSAMGMANMIPIVGMAGGMGGMIAATTAATAASQATTLSSGIKAKADLTLEYQIKALGNDALPVRKTLNAKANADGEDVITPLVEQEATAIMAETNRKR